MQTGALTDEQAEGELEVDIAFYDGEDDLVESMTWTGVDGDKQTGPNLAATSLDPVVKVVKSITGLGLKEA